MYKFCQNTINYLECKLHLILFFFSPGRVEGSQLCFLRPNSSDRMLILWTVSNLRTLTMHVAKGVVAVSHWAAIYLKDPVLREFYLFCVFLIKASHSNCHLLSSYLLKFRLGDLEPFITTAQIPFQHSFLPGNMLHLQLKCILSKSWGQE